MMHHPERACEAVVGGEDGLYLWRSLLAWPGELRSLTQFGKWT